MFKRYHIDGDIICVYIGKHPNEREVGEDYTGENIAYLKVTEVNGGADTVSFEGLNETDATEVLFMPNTFPLDIDDFPGEFSESDTDFDLVFDPKYFSEFADMWIDSDTTIDPGDFIVLYDYEDSDFARYFEIIAVSQNSGPYHITYKTITLDIMTEAMDYYTSNSRSGVEMLEKVNVDQLESQIETQVVQSGFAQDALEYLALASKRTDGFREISGLESLILTDEDGHPLGRDEIELWKLDIPMESDLDGDGETDITVDVEISDTPAHFSEGIQVKLEILGDYAVRTGGSDVITIHIDATFVQEVSISFGASGSVEWGWYGFIPYIRDCTMVAYFDIFDYTGIDFDVWITSNADDEYNNIDISNELENLLTITDTDELDARVQSLFDKYGEMMKTETDYMKIFDQSIFEMEGAVDPLHIIAYSVGINFKIHADINIMLGTNMHYQSGTRYIFWFQVKSQKAGSQTVDLIDETFTFHFHVMGKLGIKVGLEFKFAVGLFTTHLASIGLSAEVGPYLELCGYFVYDYAKTRHVGSTVPQISENMQGALYLEFGIFLDIYFNAEALDGEYPYSYPLCEEMWPLITAGVRAHVYDFANSSEEKEVIIIDVKTTSLPAFCRNMKVLDLEEGTLYQAVYSPDKYNYRLSNPNFAIDSSGKITVTVPSGVQYMECDLTMTWKVDKLAFRKYDLTSTVHLVWTNLTNKELEEKFEVSVKVGSIDTGYTTVWSRFVVKNSEFELPSKDAIKALIGYDDDAAVIDGRTENLKYEDCIGYSVDLKQKVNMDTIYYFDVVEKEYEITIQGVQNDDGTTYNQKFKALYHETFDFSFLENTGTNNIYAAKPYTKYVKIDCGLEDGKRAVDMINRSFAIQLLEIQPPIPQCMRTIGAVSPFTLYQIRIRILIWRLRMSLKRSKRAACRNMHIGSIWMN